MVQTERKESAILNKLSHRLEELPEDKLIEVLDFVDFIRNRTRDKHRRGSPEALLKHTGSWSFEDHELDHLLNRIEEMRDSELQAKSEF